MLTVSRFIIFFVQCSLAVKGEATARFDKVNLGRAVRRISMSSSWPWYARQNGRSHFFLSFSVCECVCVVQQKLQRHQKITFLIEGVVRARHFFSFLKRLEFMSLMLACWSGRDSRRNTVRYALQFSVPYSDAVLYRSLVFSMTAVPQAVVSVAYLLLY